MADEPKTYRIAEFRAENFMRLKTVAIRPDGDVVQITGANGQGKTSVLDGVLAALGGGRAIPMKPIRTGEESAVLKVDLGDLIVTRRFAVSDNAKGYTTDIKVERASGGRMDKPQDVLNAIMGRFTFDPLAFTLMKDDEQFEVLKTFVPGFDFDQSAALDRDDYAKRTDVNREAKNLRTQAEAIKLPAGATPAAVDVEALEKKLGEAASHNASIATRQANRQAAEDRLVAIAEAIQTLETERDTITARLAEAGDLPEAIDTDQVREALAAGRAANAARALVQQRADLEAKAAAKEKESADLTKAMDDREAARQKAIKAAKMPVPGLGFDPKGFITLDGEPFSQASDAQKLRTSMAIAVAMNPTLRVARLRDGSRLDSKAMRALAEYAAEMDVQVWIERVDESGSVGFVMEDGALKGDAAPAPVDDDIEEAI